MTTTEARSDWELLTAHLPAGWEELAGEMGLIRERPAHLGVKILHIGQILRLVLHQAGTSSSLRATTALAAATNVVTIAAVSLHKWMIKLGPYLTELLARMVEVSAFAPARWGGLHVIAADATTVQRPGSKGTTARVHYALRLADLSPRHIEVTDEHGGETARRFRAEPGEVWLLDRAYANPPGVAAIRNSGAHIIVRYNRGTLPLYDKLGNRIDVMSLLRTKGNRGQAYQRRAFVHIMGKGSVVAQRISGRLCWLRIPENKVEQAVQRAKREAEGVCDAETLEIAEYVVVFTTILEELTAAQVLALYGARWQIELEFKRSKSIRELDRLPNFLPETIHSWICAKLLLQLITQRIAAPTGAFPPGGTSFNLLPGVGAKAAPRPRGRRAVVRHESGLDDSMRHAVAHCAA